jgi:hypothetical protein
MTYTKNKRFIWKKKKPFLNQFANIWQREKNACCIKKNQKVWKVIQWVYIERVRYTSDPMATKARNFESTSIFSSSTICREEKTPICQDR